MARVGTWLAALLVASLALPAVTTQWSDRQSELALKERLVSELTVSAARTIQDSGFLVRDESISPAIDAEDWRARFTTAARDWNVSAFTLESKLDAYFPGVQVRGAGDSTLGAELHLYNLRVQDYVLLSSQVCADGRALALRRLRDYLPGIEEQHWDALAQESPSLAADRPRDRCWRRTQAFKTSYLEPLGLRLLDRRQRLLETIVHGDAAGYNVGFRDFLRQVLPFH